MFQFTTTHVINGSTDLTSGASLFRKTEDNKGNDVFEVKGVNTFKKDNIVHVFKAVAVEGKPAVLTLNLSSVDANEGDTLRLSIYIRLTQSDSSSYYANDTQYKGRPFTIEFPWMGNAADTAKNLKKLINKYGLLVFEKPVVKVTQEGETITLTAVNEFQRFYTFKLEKFVETDKPYGESYIEIKDAFELKEEGVESFGDYGYILRNIKLPTHEHTRAWAPKAHEMPVPGALYDQYTIHYCAKRGVLGMNAVGEVTKSLTTHVFFVNQNVSTNFGDILAQVCEVETVTIPEVSKNNTTDDNVIDGE